MAEFVLPDFLQESEEEIHKRMIDMAPPNYETSEGSLYWDHTAPTAMVRSRLVEYELTLTLMMMFPQFASGPFLDYHGEPIGVIRRPAAFAVGNVTLRGKPGTPIEAGSVVSTIGDENEAGLLFKITENGTVPEEGIISLRVMALEAGAISNVPAGTIQGIVNSIPGITSITNEEPLKDGTDVEDDETYRQRIIEHHQNKPLSGARSDYVKWAKEVSGVGDVIVLPLWNGPKTVKVLITNSERELASEELIAAVQEHIAPDEDKGGGRAPIGAIVTVDTITLIPIDIQFTLEIETGYQMADVIENIKSSVNSYFSDLPLVKWAEVIATIVNTTGVSDCSDVLLNDSTKNIILQIGERAVVGEVTAL
ncbi:baseplate J/gp47 family protein [Rummeliibacillus sp. POC4]|uniref:baseplate J/gp47 family protein n=1 Tax=Rummeliibacillus sp. POC4 TaxID=2305899 RepID=UPI000E6675D2|nr:baseplate J/gp47 family protein [Rummeliibacillus sp. POC4]RIJ63597.1 baseplate J/gp47 family protein [Rummeliibacillus sp. POC4]